MGNPYEDLIQNPKSAPAPARPSVPTGVGSGNPYDALVNQPTPGAAKPKPQAELRSAEYSPREWLGNKAQDALIALGMKPYEAGHLGRGVRDVASLFPPVGAAISGADAGYYATRDKPDLLMAGISGLGMVPGVQAARRAVGGMPQRALAPAEEELGHAADDAYNAWRSSPVRYSPDMMDDVSNEIVRTLIQRGNDPEIKRGALNVGQRLKTQTGMTNNDFEILRKQLGGGATRDEIAAGEAAKEVLENYMMNPPRQHVRVGTPQEIASDRQLLLTGRGNVAAQKRSGVLTDAANVAELKGETGSDVGRVLQNKIDALETTKTGQKAIRGYTDEEADAARNAITDTMTRRMQGAGNALQKIGGSGTLIPAATTGAGLWHQFGLDPYTAGAAGLMAQGGLYGAGSALKSAAGSRMEQGVAEAAANLRMRSPLAQAPGSPYERVTDPLAQAKDASTYLMYPWLRQEGEDYVEQMRTPFDQR